jgi:hypothetical protein
MNNCNPNTIESNGQRQIASYDYPLIGPYDSSDPYVIEYQMLLMKLSGISATTVDWYGEQGSNGDETSLLSASNKIVSATQTYGLGVGVCLEDRFATSTSEVTTNINYMEQNYATQSNYIRVGSNNEPLTLLFGPITQTQPSDWTTILSGVSQTPALVPLQYQASQVGTPAVGEAAWIYQDKGTSDDLTVQKNFLAYEAGNFSNSIGDAYVGYNDYYAAGGDPSAASGFVIPQSDANGQTLTETLNQDQTYSKNIAAIQIATWNDYGEGTMIEPTVQNGFTSLEQIQKFTGVPYGLSQLQLVYQLYEAREEFQGNSTEEAVLSQTSNDINQLDFPDAEKSLADAVTSAPATISLINSLTLNGTAAFNLANDTLIINYSPGSDPIATIRSDLSSGYNGGAWNGLGIDSSYAAANPSYGIGVVDGNDGVLGTPVSANQIEVAYTLYGDANLDGKVDITDFNIFAPNFGLPTTLGWEAGDFNYSGTVDIADFNLFSSNFGLSDNGTTVSMPAADYAALNAFAAANGLLADVPEPSCLALAAICSTAFLRRRRIGPSVGS